MGYYFFDYASFNQAANALVKAGIVLHYSTPVVNATYTILGNRGFTVTLQEDEHLFVVVDRS
jgi:hypothetical protein